MVKLTWVCQVDIYKKQSVRLVLPKELGNFKPVLIVSRMIGTEAKRRACLSEVAALVVGEAHSSVHLPAFLRGVFFGELFT